MSGTRRTKPPVIEIRFRRKDGQPPVAVVITNQLLLWQRAREWDSRMRDRNRWIGDEKLRTEVTELSRTHLAELNVDESTVVTLARAKIIEIVEEAPESDVETDESSIVIAIQNAAKRLLATVDTLVSREARRMPWESLLTMAVRKF